MAKELKFRQKNSNNPRDYFVPSTRVKGGIDKYGFNVTDNIKTILLSILQSIANGTGSNQSPIEDLSYNAESHTLMISLKNGDTFETELEAINGKSAYDLAMEERVANGGEIISLDEWFDTLKGESAYHMAMRIEYDFYGLDRPSKDVWLQSLHGKDGTNGKDGNNGDVITNIVLANNKMRVFVKHYDGTTNYYDVTLPNITPNPTSPQIVEVTELFSGTLEAARTYASNNRNKMFQWILQDVDEQGNSLEKIIWHTGNGRFIDAIGFVHVEEFED